MADYFDFKKISSVIDLRRADIQSIFDTCSVDDEDYYEGYYDGLGNAIAMIRNVVTPADVAPVIHSEWGFVGNDIRCKNCGKIFKNAYDVDNIDRYCRHCGAKMDGGT